MKKWLDLLEKVGLAIFTFGIVIYLLIAAKFWVADLQFWFFRAGDYRAFVLLSIGIFVFSEVLKRFLKWEIHNTLAARRHKR